MAFRTQRQIDRLSGARREEELKDIDYQETQYPESGTFGQFADRRGLQFGPLRITKEAFYANDGTTDAVRIDSDGFHGFNSSSVETIRISSSGIEGYGETGNTFKFYDEVGGTLYGQMGYQEHPTYGPAFWWQSKGNSDVYIEADSELYLVSGATAGDSIFIYNQSSDSGDPLLLGSEGGISLSADQNVVIEADADDSSSGDAFLVGEGVALRSKGSDNIFFIYDGSNYKAVEIKDSGGDTYLKYGTSTAKTAVVETSKGYKALYCTESPEVWFMDFCEGKRVKKKWWKFWDKQWEIKPSRTFLEVTSAPYIPIKTGISGVVQLWAKRRGHEKKRFESKTKQEFESNNKFWSESGKGKNAG